jgi:hypothetical protein
VSSEMVLVRNISDGNRSVVNKLQSNIVFSMAIFFCRKRLVFARGFVGRRKCWSEMTSFVVVCA